MNKSYMSQLIITLIEDHRFPSNTINPIMQNQTLHPMSLLIVAAPPLNEGDGVGQKYR